MRSLSPELLHAGGPPATPACASYCFLKLGARTTRRTTTTGVYPENEDLPRALEVQGSADGAQGSGVGKLPRDEGHLCWPVTPKSPLLARGPGVPVHTLHPQQGV